jgi:hypothetical protein
MIVKSSSSTEKAKLETLYSPNNGSTYVIKIMMKVRTINGNHHLNVLFGLT